VPDHGTVLLLDPGLIVLAVRTTSCEHQPGFRAVVDGGQNPLKSGDM
jgi:hypothetical protein